MPSAWKICSSIASSSAWIAPEVSGVVNANISTLVNWCTRYKPAAGPARGARLGAEAVRQPDVPDGQLAFVEQLVGEHAAQRDLGGADQAEVAVLDRVDLRLDPSGGEPDAFQNTVTGKIGSDDGREPGSDQGSDRELLKCQLQEHGVVLEKVEAGARDLAAGLEVDQVEGLAELDMVLDREVESPRRADLAELAAVVLGDARRGRRDGSGWELASGVV